jgi:uncharacterized membrane protein YfcA
LRVCAKAELNAREGESMFTVPFFLTALLSEIVGTVAGFGSSVFFVPLAGFFFDFHQVPALTSILHVFSNTAKLVLFGEQVNAPMTSPTLLGLATAAVLCCVRGLSCALL